MPEEMNLCGKGESKVPPGFRFHPTEEELLQYYLRKKVGNEPIDLDVIREVDLNKLEPWDIQEKCMIGSGTQSNEWYFFSHKDKKYPTGTRTNRATAAGFWKATGRDKVINSNHGGIGMRKTLVFYKGRAPHGHKSDWIMHEYRLQDNAPGSVQEEGWVVCRVFKKKIYQKQLDCLRTSNPPSSLGSKHAHYPPYDSNYATPLNGILSYITANGKHQGDATLSTNFSIWSTALDLSNSDNPTNLTPPFDRPSLEPIIYSTDKPGEQEQSPPIGKWVALDRLVASQLDGMPKDWTDHFGFCASSINSPIQIPGPCHSQNEPWNFYTSSSSSTSQE